MDGSFDPKQFDPAPMVVVPARPGPVVPLSTVDRSRDELDEVLYDLFGEPDEGGAGPLDAVLVLGGAAAIIAGLTTLAPAWVLVAGVIAFGLGSVLPLRTLCRRRADRRRTARLRAAIGEGVPLRTTHPVMAELVVVHQRCLDPAASLASWRRVQVEVVAHAALLEAATLLSGRSPVTPAEVGYVQARVAVLSRLGEVLSDPAIDDGARRQARARARMEVEAAAGSAVDDADALVRALRGSA